MHVMGRLRAHVSLICTYRYRMYLLLLHAHTVPYGCMYGTVAVPVRMLFSKTKTQMEKVFMVFFYIL